jgi:hypothetical protein
MRHILPPICSHQPSSCGRAVGQFDHRRAQSKRDARALARCWYNGCALFLFEPISRPSCVFFASVTMNRWLFDASASASPPVEGKFRPDVTQPAARSYAVVPAASKESYHLTRNFQPALICQCSLLAPFVLTANPAAAVSTVSTLRDRPAINLQYYPRSSRVVPQPGCLGVAMIFSSPIVARAAR